MLFTISLFSTVNRYSIHICTENFRTVAKNYRDSAFGLSSEQAARCSHSGRDHERHRRNRSVATHPRLHERTRIRSSRTTTTA